MSDKVEDLPGTPLKIIKKDNRFYTFYIENKKDFSIIYSPLGIFKIKKKWRKLEKENEGSFEDGKVLAPMSGKVIKVFKKEGEEVKENDPLCVIEAMKMQNEIRSKVKGKIEKSYITENKAVKKGDIIFLISIENEQ